MLYTAPFGASSLRASKTNLKDWEIFQLQLNIVAGHGGGRKLRCINGINTTIYYRKKFPR